MNRATCQTRALFIFLMLGYARGQEAGPAPEPAKHEIAEGFKSSFSLPLLTWIRERPSLSEMFDKELSLSMAFNNPLLPANSPAGNSGLGSVGDRGSSSRNVSFSVKDNPITFWYFQAAFSVYLQPELKRPWNPDFTYSFGYDDWHPYTLSLTYSNYGGNRLQPNRPKKEKFTNFEQGGISLGYKFQFPKEFERPFLIHSTSTFGWSVHHNVIPRYGDLATSKVLPWKQSESFSCTNNVYKFWYWNATAIYYPYKTQQQPWDPDFTYGFGYFDYRPGKISVEYNNYAGNRYPWRNQGKSPGRFRSGGISVMWSVK